MYADMNIFKKFGSKKNSKGAIGESFDSDLHPRRLAEVRPCEWPHTPFLQEAGIHAEFMQFVANAGLSTSSQMSVTSTKSSQTSLFKALHSCLEIILLK